MTISKQNLTSIGNTAVIVAIGAGAAATASVAPIALTVVALSSAAVATGALYAKLSAPNNDKTRAASE